MVPELARTDSRNPWKDSVKSSDLRNHTWTWDLSSTKPTKPVLYTDNPWPCLASNPDCPVSIFTIHYATFWVFQQLQHLQLRPAVCSCFTDVRCVSPGSAVNINGLAGGRGEGAGVNTAKPGTWMQNMYAYWSAGPRTCGVEQQLGRVGITSRSLVIR